MIKITNFKTKDFISGSKCGRRVSAVGKTIEIYVLIEPINLQFLKLYEIYRVRCDGKEYALVSKRGERFDEYMEVSKLEFTKEEQMVTFSPVDNLEVLKRLKDNG